MNKNLTSAIKEITSLLKDEPTRVFNHRTLVNVLKLKREIWDKYLKGLPVETLVTRLIEEKVVEKIRLAHESYQKEFIRYLFNNPSVYEVALSLKSGSYLSHGTAVFLHGLNNQLPKTVYTNKEQSKKPASSGKLSQESINRAFSNKQRESQFVISFGGSDIVLLSGKNTGKLHVTELQQDGYPLQVTSIERTLVDIAVRPNYAGGTSQVLEAYKGAIGRVSVNAIQAILKKLGYTYPYHQVVGFYLDKAGYPPEQVAWLRERFPIEFDFFLEYAIPEIAREYSQEWRLFYPKGL